MDMIEQAAIFLLTAVLLVPLFQRLKLGAVLGYLAAGMVIGPWGLGVAAEAKATLQFAEFGIVLLLFLIGLELDPARLWALRRSVFGLGGAQVGVTGLVLALGALAFGLRWEAAVVAGAGLAALGLNLVWRAGLGGEPPTLVLVIVAVLGALGALSVARHVVIIGTALAGAWSLIVGGMALAGNASALEAASGGAVWVFYPLDAGMPTRWVIPGWIALSVAGVAVQLATTGRTGRRKRAAAVERTRR